MFRIIVAFLASLLTAVQAYLIYHGKQGICFNDGCAVVDSLTTVSPFYFNIAGLIYFQLLFWSFLWGREKDDYQQKFARLLLQAGLGAEAVLIYFQYNIATVFCSYCLIVFSFIFLLNLLSGVKQLLRAVVVFAAVFVACMSLQFKAGGADGGSLIKGSVAVVAKADKTNHVLVFSKTCPHCEKVIESLRENNTCSIMFNPLERIDDFNFPGATMAEQYDPKINISFLRRIGIGQIPLLMTRQKDEILFLIGEKKIMDYVDANCREQSGIEKDDSQAPAELTGQSHVSASWPIAAQAGEKYDSECATDADCSQNDGGSSQSVAQ